MKEVSLSITWGVSEQFWESMDHNVVRDTWASFRSSLDPNSLGLMDFILLS